MASPTPRLWEATLEDVEREEAKRDVCAFLRACWIEDKDTGGLIPFDLWPCQEDFARLLDGYDRVFGLKARQLGFTWVILGHLLRLGLFWGNRLFLIVSQSGDDSAAAIRRLKVMHSSLADSWQQPVIEDNVTSLAFANGSRYHALKATKRAGRSHAAYAALADEVAFWEWPAEQMAALDSACKRLYAVTTGNGPGDYAHRLWRDAQDGRGLWKAAFYPWSDRPDRLADPDWYRLNVEEAPEPRLARREYAASPEDAFAAPEGLFFERFDRRRNVAQVQVVHDWQTWRCVDFGYHHPACAWVQQAPSGQRFVVGELVPHDLTTEEFAQAILAKEAAWGLVERPRATYCDPAGRAANVQTAQSEIEIFRRAGLNPISKASSIRDGCVRLIGALADPDLPLVVSEACAWTIEAFASVRPDKHRPDLYDETSEYTHILDALRYFVVNVGSGQGSGYKPPIPSAAHRPITAGLLDREF